MGKVSRIPTIGDYTIFFNSLFFVLYSVTTHNHASSATNAPPMVHVDRMALINMSDNCNDEKKAIEKECNPFEERAKCPDSSALDEAKAIQKELTKDLPRNSRERAIAQSFVDIELEYYALEVQDNPCLKALACTLTTFNRAKAGGCCPPQTPEHLIPASQFGTGRGEGHPVYPTGGGTAPCMCATGGKSTATHGLLGAGRKKYMDDRGIATDGKDKVWTVRDSAKCGAHSANEVHQHCSTACLEAQLVKGHENIGIKETEEITGIQENVDPNRITDFLRAYVGG